MDVKKYVRSMEVEHLADGVTKDTISDSKIAETAFREFERHEVVEVGEGKMVPYHAVEYIVHNLEVQDGTVDDATCQPIGGGGDDENAILDENSTPLETENGETLLYNEGE